MKHWLIGAWRGEKKLWKVFWLGLVFPQICGAILGFVQGTRYVVMHQGQHIDAESLRVSSAELTFSWWWMAIWCVYYVLLGIAVWRSSGNASHKAWGYAARAVVILLALAAFGGLLGTLSAPPSAYGEDASSITEPYGLPNVR